MENKNNGLTLLDIFIAIARRIKILLLVPLVLACFANVYLKLFSVPLYISTAKFTSSSSEKEGGFGNAAGIAAQFGITIPTNESIIQWSYSDIIKSRSFARKVLNRSFKSEKFKEDNYLHFILQNGKENSGNEKNLKIVASKFISMIDIYKKQGNVYVLSIISEEPNLSRDINSAIIEELDLFQKSHASKKVSEARKFIEERIFETKSQLESSEDALKEFNTRNRRIQNSPALQLEQVRLQREATVLTGVFTTLKQQLETAKIQEVKNSDNIIVIDPPESALGPSSPNIRFGTLMTFLLVLTLGIIFVIFIEIFQNASKSDMRKIKELKLLLNNNIKFLTFIKNNK